MYSVMLVDDEEEVRQAMAKKLDWGSIGFQMAGTAENGEEALELAEKLRPDVVMTDIQMPFMDGLTFCQKLKEMQPNVKLVIFSGFDQFEYAQEAIKLEVEEYILKPIDAAKLREVFVRIRETLDREMDEKRNMEMLYRYYQESLPIIRDQFLIGMLEGKFGEEEIQTFSQSYEMDLESPFYSICVLRLDETAETPLERQLLTLSLKKIAEEHLKDSLNCRSFVFLDRVVVLALLTKKERLTAFIHNVDQICKISRRVLENNTTAGIGPACTALTELPTSYQGALDAVEYRVLLEPNHAIYIGDIEPETGGFSLGSQEMGEILRQIKVGSREELTQAVTDFLETLRAGKPSIQNYQVHLMELVTEILKLARSYQLDIEKTVGEAYSNLKKFDSLERLGEWLLELCAKVRECIQKERTNSTKILVEKAKDYLACHYGESEISVDTLSSCLNVSPAYFSTIFKKETGENFVQYVTRIRMEEAVRLLETTEDKTYIISMKVGYTEPNYFSYVFKKRYGISPSRYRMKKMEKYET